MVLQVYSSSTTSLVVLRLADAIAEATKEGAFSLIGGGDSVLYPTSSVWLTRYLTSLQVGGALLEAIEGKVLPGVAAIEK